MLRFRHRGRSQTAPTEGRIWRPFLFLAVLFVTAVATEYVLAAAVVLRHVGRKKIKPISRADRVILVLAALGLLCMTYGRFIEPNWLATTHIEIRSPKIPTDKRPIRIALFSDLH